MVPLATLLGAQHYKASTGSAPPNIYIAQLTLHYLQIIFFFKSPIINIQQFVCIHRKTVWKIGIRAKYACYGDKKG